MREFELYWARNEDNRVFGDILLICMWFRRVKNELSPKRDSHEFGIR